MTTYLITGGAGFIGSHLTDFLIAHGHHVLVIDNLSTGRWSNIQHLQASRQFHFAEADITTEVVLDRMASQADVIIHLAAAVGVQLVVEQAVHTIDTNVIGTERVLKAAARYRRPILLASTSEVYGKGSRLPFAEDDDIVLGPTSRSRWGYAASKMIDEFLGLAYYRELGLPVTIFRLFNTVGPRQTGRYGMVIPRLMQQALAGERLTIYGDGTQTRCFCDVADVVEAVVGLALNPNARGKVFNIGSSEEVSINELANRIKQITASPSPLEYVPYAQAYAPGFEDMQRRVPDISRIQVLLGWSPRLSLNDTLTRIKTSLVD